MSTFNVSKWFEIEAEDYEEAYKVAEAIGTVVMGCDEIICTDCGDIDVEQSDEEDEE